MRLETKEDILKVVLQDEWMMGILRKAKTLGLPDWWVCAGFVRSKIWDTIYDYTERTPLPDVDVVYFDPSDISEETEKTLEDQLRRLDPSVPWSVKNEARMHLVNGFAPFDSAEDAISQFAETATALGLTMTDDSELILTARLGIADAVNGIVRANPCMLASRETAAVYEARIAKKNWHLLWPHLQIIHV